MAITRATASSVIQGLPKSKSTLAGNLPILSGSYESIATVTVGSGGQSSVSFTSISGAYKHLQLRILTRGTASQYTAPVLVGVNSDTGSNYSTHQMLGNGSSAYADNHANASYILDGWGGFQSVSGLDTANVFGVGIIDFLEYSSTTKYKTVRALWGREMNTSSPVTGRVILESGCWRNTSAITSITFSTDASYGVSFAQHSTFALYGIK